MSELLELCVFDEGAGGFSVAPRACAVLTREQARELKRRSDCHDGLSDCHDDLVAACKLGLELAKMLNHPHEHHIEAALAKADKVKNDKQ